MTTLAELSELPLDENGHLADNWLFIPLDCADRPGGLQVPPASSVAMRRVGLLDVELAEFFGVLDMCPAAVTIEKGTDKAHLHVNVQRFLGSRAKFDGEPRTPASDQCDTCSAWVFSPSNAPPHIARAFRLAERTAAG